MFTEQNCTTNASPPFAMLVSHACQFCRKRKIKCDRLVGGCTHCKRIGSECTYPASQRKGRPRNGLNNTAGKTSVFAITSREARLLARIKELEGMLGSSTDGESPL
jgi:Fungal Zn(2)-Cys(6) binuclear cluster domain